MRFSIFLTALPLGVNCFQTPFSSNVYFGAKKEKYRQIWNIGTSFRPLYASSSGNDGSGGDLNENNDQISSSSGDRISDELLYSDLQKRQAELIDKNKEVEERWCNADCQTSVPLQFDDWVRRITSHRYPIVAVGTANGSVRVADLQSGEELAVAVDAHAPTGGDTNCIDCLFRNYDGGGVIAIAMYEDIVVSAGREGGIKIWKYDNEKGSLIPQGQPGSLDGVSVTTLDFDDYGDLWVGCFDKTLHKYEMNISSNVLKMAKLIAIEFDYGIVSMEVNNDIGLCAVGLQDGTLHFISSTSGHRLSTWNPFEIGVCARSIAVLEIDIDTYNVVCGGSDGSMHMRPLSLNMEGEISMYPFSSTKEPAQIQPQHGGAVVDIVGRKGGVFVSGAQDGSLRIWDCRDYEELPLTKTTRSPARAMYHLIGYKVWLGSICIDKTGLRLFSDGSDNSIVLHDFSQEIYSED